MSPKVWFITGCSSGFGTALVHEILGRGDKVIASARNLDKIADLKTAGADIMALNVTDPLPKIKEVAQTAFNLHGRIDYLVNNAGLVQVGGIEELTPELTLSQFQTNVFGSLNVARAFLPYMRAARTGVIANISSMGAWGRYAGVGVYAASKYAVTGFTESLHDEVAEFGIKVCCVEPGYFRSQLLGSKASGTPGIKDYEDSAVSRGVALMDQFNGKQRGDIKKGMKVLVDVLTEKTGKPVPLRLLLGPDALQEARGKCEETLGLIEEWKDIVSNTDVEE
jgi:NAD(P)-dependent dehydrogenase (short-subunit alcohol dehydrogenase family)